jgi:hypothetical protein
MTTKEKANELFDSFIRLQPTKGITAKINAKNGALRAVNEVNWCLKQMGKGSKFYDEVKQEIEKL